MRKFSFLGVCVVLLSLTACHQNHGDLLATKQYKTTKTVYANDNKTEQMDVSMVFEYPTESAYPQMLDSVKRFVIDCVFNTDIDSVYVDPASSPSQAMATKVSELVKVYKQDNNFFLSEDTIEETEQSLFFSASYDLQASVHSIVDDVMYYMVSTYRYYGGAHGLNTVMYYNINLRTGQQLAEKDVLPDMTEEQLSERMKTSLAQSAGVTVGELEDAGFFVEDIKPNGNFYVTDDSVVFHFNQYEIASYAMGPVEIAVAK
ncbi:MAG TPA: hypothetical protein DCG33_05235 [Prevotellaceae bacterium]|nr:hypothetical protein [Prevotellaceae bacterium]